MDDHSDQLDFEFAADDLLEFPRDLGEKGYFKFHSEQKQAMLELENVFGVVLNKRVRLRLIGWNEELEGKITLESLLLPTNQSTKLRLCMGTVTFEHTDIECCHVLE